ncbi:MAG: hypothetical protein K6E29_08865 [Cyanobacteria bacterium RUI128]|nr:hypothetical protein [Cyanobacteria bacterium RUI128]
MSEETNIKVINMFNRHNNDLPQDTEEQVKFFAGFNYVKLKRDVNGKKFVPSQMISYAEKCHYIVSVLRNVDGEDCLYNYDIKSADLPKFIKALDNKTLNGTLIEIEKYIPEDLA